MPRHLRRQRHRLPVAPTVSLIGEKTSSGAGELRLGTRIAGVDEIPHFSFFPFLRGEGRDEGRELVLTLAYAAAPHPSPLPVKDGERR